MAKERKILGSFITQIDLCPMYPDKGYIGAGGHASGGTHQEKTVNVLHFITGSKSVGIFFQGNILGNSSGETGS